MSGYEKTQSAGLLNYETSGGLHEPTPFGPYAPPPYAAPLVHSYSVDSPRDEDYLNYVAHPDLSNHRQMENSRPTMVDQRFRQFPRITSIPQLQGGQGSTIQLHLQSPHELRGSPRISFFLLFASKRVECALQLITDRNASPKQYALSAEVPVFASTAWHSFAVPFSIMMASCHSDVPCLSVDIGVFTYTDQVAPQDRPPRKRSLSSVSEDIARRLPNKHSAQPLQTETPTEAAVFGVPPYKPLVSTPIASSVSHLSTEAATPPRLPNNRYSASVASATSVKAPSPRTPASWSPSIAPLHQVSPAAMVDTMPGQGIAGDNTANKTPPLVRTSTIPQPSTCNGSAAVPQPFNPYTIYPSKAVLRLNGDLNSMAEVWSLEEWDAKRRLVQFTRQQKGSTIHANFRSIAPEDRQANTICISCIWWEEKNDFYVTSVDTIFLLESLVAVRFTVEEKNRIRRNLEGFRPLTVSKSKPDSEEFFKIIMGFPNPKPRNIEKDVKVFPWKILAHALKKIIGKYSASYSSTAGALPTPAVSRYASNGASESGTDARASTSPQMNELGHSTSPYAVSTASGSPHMTQMGVSVPISNGLPAGLHLHVPPVIPGYSYPVTHSYAQTSPYSQSFTRSPQPMTAPAAAGRFPPSWDAREDTIAENGTQQDMADANMNAYHFNHLLSSLAPSQTYVPAPSYTMSHSGI